MANLTESKINALETCKNFAELEQLAPANDWGFTIAQIRDYSHREPDNYHVQPNCYCAFGWLWHTHADPFFNEDAIYYPSGRLPYEPFDHYSIFTGYKITPENPKPKYLKDL